MALHSFKRLMIGLLLVMLPLAAGPTNSAAAPTQDLAELKKLKRERLISTITDARQTCVVSQESADPADFQKCFRTEVKSGFKSFFLELRQAEKGCALEPSGEQRQICALSRFLNTKEAEPAVSPDPLPAMATSLDDFARCLTAAGIVFYGVDWCPHCQAQKKLFGDSFRLITAIDCVKDADVCQNADIEGYPTWILKDQNRLLGTQPLDALAGSNGCKLPQE